MIDKTIQMSQRLKYIAEDILRFAEEPKIEVAISLFENCLGMNENTQYEAIKNKDAEEFTSKMSELWDSVLKFYSKCGSLEMMQEMKKDLEYKIFKHKQNELKSSGLNWKK